MRKVIYTRPKHRYTSKDLWRIARSMSTDLRQYKDAEGRFLIKTANILNHWIQDRQLHPASDPRSGSSRTWTEEYIDFIKWFDGALDVVEEALRWFDVMIPELSEFTTVVRNAIALYRKVRQNFPIE